MVEPTKICADCCNRKAWSEFWPKRRWPDGTMRQPHAYCKPCHQIRTNDWERQKREADPNWQRKRAQRNRAAIKADPDRYAASLAYRREWARRRYGYKRVLLKPMNRPSHLLNVAPFAAWLHTVMQRDGSSVRDTAERLRLGDKTMREILHERREVELHTVDRTLLEDGTITLRELYPDLYTEVAA